MLVSYYDKACDKWTVTAAHKTLIRTFLETDPPQRDTRQPSTKPQIAADPANIAMIAIAKHSAAPVPYKKNEMVSN